MGKITKVDHIGIAVKDLNAAIALYETVFGLETETIEVNEEFKVKLCFIPVGEVLVEFLEPTEKGSQFDKFIEEKGEAIHHIAYQVTNIDSMLKKLKNSGVKLLNEEAKPGGAGSKVAFIDPQSTNNILIELVERIGNI